MSTPTLREIALTHARCRTLSADARAFFEAVANGVDIASEYDPDFVDTYFFEAALSTATRAGQSRSRRYMGDNLKDLRRALLSGERVSVVTAQVTLTIEAEHINDINAIVGTLRRHKVGDATITTATVTNVQGA